MLQLTYVPARVIPWVVHITLVTRRLWENCLNWITDPAPTPSRDHSKKTEKEEENRPPASQPSRIPRQRKREHHQQHLSGANGNSPGIDLRPRWMKQTPKKHPQPPQHPRPAANENSSQVDPWNQPDPGWLYKQAQRSRGKESTKRSHRDYYSG